MVSHQHDVILLTFVKPQMLDKKKKKGFGVFFSPSGEKALHIVCISTNLGMWRSSSSVYKQRELCGHH